MAPSPARNRRPAAAGLAGLRRAIGPAVAATAVALGAMGLSACSGGGALPETVRARVISRMADETVPLLVLSADVGGGCNVIGPYTISTDIEPTDSGLAVTLTGHDFDSDGDECAETATAQTEIELPTPTEAAPVDVEVTHDGTANRYRVERAGSTLRVTELSAGNVGLVCRDRSERPETGCTVPVDP